jgi:hypothetical protein
MDRPKNFFQINDPFGPGISLWDMKPHTTLKNISTMKNLISIVSLTALASLAILAALAAFDVPLPYACIASDIIGFSAGAGVLAFFVADYAPSKSLIDLDAARRERNALAPATRLEVNPEPVESAFDPSGTLNWLAGGSMEQEPSTMSLI